MFLHAADLTVVFLSIVFMLCSLHVQTHANFTHSFAQHFLCCQNKKEETHAHSAWHYFTMAKTAQTNTFSRSRSFLRLCQGDTGRASPLDRLCVSQSRGNGSHLRSPPWLSHVTSIATIMLFSQQWPCFKSIFVNMLEPGRATTSSPHPRQPLREFLRAEGRQVKKARKLFPIGTFVGIVDTSSSTKTHHRED